MWHLCYMIGCKATYICYLIVCVCLFVLCRSDDASFYVVTCELKTKWFLCLWGCRDVALFILNFG